MEKSITMTTFTDETLREEFISKYRYTDQFTFVLLNESDDSRKANAEAIADYWLSKFHSYQAYLIAKYGIILDDTDIQQG